MSVKRKQGRVSICHLINEIDRKKSAIQRDFVWDGAPISPLFDSMMRRLPSRNSLTLRKPISPSSSDTVLDVSGAIAGVPVRQRLTLYRDLKRVDLENSIDWTPGHFMKIQQVIPLDMPGAEIRNGVPFGSAAEADIMPQSGPRSRDEVPAAIWRTWRQIQDWITASTPEWNLTVSADHQMFTVDQSAIRGDMIRGTRFNPLKTVRETEENGTVQPREVRIEQPAAGTYVYRYSITSGAGNWPRHTLGVRGWPSTLP